ncbi:MAG: crotonase/enoyl-CoA hydratase family protein [Myxococcota bacterium]
MSERIRIDRTGHVAEVVMTRPEARNGLDFAMFEAIIAAGEALIEDRSVRAVILRGEGKAFCAGLDFRSFLADPTVFRRLAESSGGGPANRAQRVGWIWREVPVPVIASVHGPCFGGGLQIALGADMRIAAPDAAISVMEIEWGIIPDMGATKTLLPLVRPDVARELTFTGRIVNGDEAAQLGLVTRTNADPLEEARRIASTIAQKSPDAIAAAKDLINRGPDLSAADSLALELKHQLTLLGSPNQMEAVQARMAKRAPEFKERRNG